MLNKQMTFLTEVVLMFRMFFPPERLVRHLIAGPQGDVQYQADSGGVRRPIVVTGDHGRSHTEHGG